MEQIEKQKATGVSKSSESTDSRGSWRYPKTRKEAIQLKDLGARISLSENMAGNIVMFLQSIGADNELPERKAERVAWLNHFHMQLAINNPLWPTDLPFGFVYGAFVNAVMYNRVELKGHNIHAFITAFKSWITQSGVEDNLREAYHRSNPDAAPKQLEGREAPEESEETKKIIADGYVDEPPATVKRLIDTLEMMHGSMEAAIEALANKSAKSYRRRLYNTRQKYIDEGKWPEQSEPSEPPEPKPE